MSEIDELKKEIERLTKVEGRQRKLIERNQILELELARVAAPVAASEGEGEYIEHECSHQTLAECCELCVQNDQITIANLSGRVAELELQLAVATASNGSEVVRDSGKVEQDA